MKKKVIKKYANELVKSMRYWTDAMDMGYYHWKGSSCKIIKGKRARQLTRDEVIDYVNDNIRPLKPLWFRRTFFNKNKLYMIACYIGESQLKRRDRFDVCCADSRSGEMSGESWILPHKVVCKKPEMTAKELDAAVDRFMLSNGYKITGSWLAHTYADSKGNEVYCRDAHIWYLTGMRSDIWDQLHQG